MKPRLCVVPGCGHADDTDWHHLAPERRTPILAHLRALAEEAAA